jgi:hypothetical protein
VKLRTVLALCLVLTSCQADGVLAPGQAPPIRDLVPAPSALRRLSVAQYTSAIHEVFGADITVPPRSALEPDVESSGYLSVDASSVTISRRGVSQYESAAYRIAHQALDDTHRATVVPCAPSAANDPVCARQVLQALGRRLFRRPMDTVDLDEATQLATDAADALTDFYAGLEFGIAYLLQSPRFLFREELGVDDPSTPGERAYDGYEMASRLAFFLWNAPPDAALLDAAAAGELDTADGVRLAADRLLDDPRADGGIREIAYEWFGLSGLDDLSKDATVFTSISPEVGPAAREETQHLLTHVFRSDMDARDLLTTRDTFVDRKLASIYEIPAPRTPFDMVTLPVSAHREGLLGEVSFLALYAHPTSTSPTLRGRFIRERLLCERVPSPPVGVNTAIPAPSPGALTLRTRLEMHQQVAYCAGCHRQMDAMGLGFEAFDGLGRARDEENGVAIDASGDLDGAHFRDALELSRMLHDDPRFSDCMVHQAYRIATGHLETEGELGTLRRLSLEFAANGYSLRQLLEMIVVSDGFRRATPQP